MEEIIIIIGLTFSVFVIIYLVMLRKRDNQLRRKGGTYKRSELSESFKKSISKSDELRKK
jgi:hypothetical protein